MADTDRPAGQRADRFHRVLIHQILSPLIGSTIAVAYGIGRLDLRALGTGMAITATLALFSAMHRLLIQPRLKRIAQDWLRMEMEMFASVAEHVLGTMLALVACGRALGFVVAPTASWLLLAGVVLVFPILHGAEMAVDYYRQLREKERVEQDLRALATQAELKALKAQINPHFLFNTLNAIAQLVHTNPALAEATVERLAKMLRYALAGSERGQVPLEEELAFVDDYLEVERARFGERLHVTREIAPEVSDVPVPSLILQPLVENAVNHGRGDGGDIDIHIRIEPVDDGVAITIADRGPGIPAGYRVGDSSGHGLRNVDERLRKAYGHGLEIRRNEPQGTAATIRITGGGRA